MASVKNEKLVKAVIDQSTLASSGVLLDQQKKMIDMTWDMSTLKKMARKVAVLGGRWEATKIGIGRRAAMAREEATTPAMRRSINAEKIELSPFTVVVPLQIDEEFLETNVERYGAENTVLKMFQAQAATDLEEQAMMGDTLGQAVIEADYLATGGSAVNYVKDKYLAQGNGWLKLARSGHLLDADGVSIGASLLGKISRRLPVKWRRDPRSVFHNMSSDLASVFAEKLAARQTVKGDVVLETGVPNMVLGSPIMPVPLFPYNPVVVEHLTLPAAGAGSATFRFPVVKSATEIVLPTSLAGTATAKYVKDTDYEIDYDGSDWGAGVAKIRAKAGGALAAGATVKVTYTVLPQILYTHHSNLIFAVGVDTVSIKKAEDIFADTHDYVLRFKAAYAVEEADACVLTHGISESDL